MHLHVGGYAVRKKNKKLEPGIAVNVVVNIEGWNKSQTFSTIFTLLNKTWTSIKLSKNDSALNLTLRTREDVDFIRAQKRDKFSLNSESFQWLNFEGKI